MRQRVPVRRHPIRGGLCDAADDGRLEDEFGCGPTVARFPLKKSQLIQAKDERDI